MTTEEMLAREALILTLLRGFPSLASSITKGTIKSYVDATEDYGFDPLRKACERYRAGDVEGYDRRWAPNTAELATMARMYDSIEKRQDQPVERLVSYPIGGEPPPRAVPLGPTSVDFGHGRIDMRNLSHEDKEHVLKHQRLPDRTNDKRIGFTPKFQRA